jgi:peptidoglycan hydrolase-like protein with peptidoglycan-binding domain
MSRAGDTVATPTEPAIGNTATSSDGEGRRPNPRRGGRIVVVVVLTLGIAGAGVAAAVGFGGSDDATTASTVTPPSTTRIVRTTVTETETVDGNLDYGTATTVAARAGAGGVGTITWLPGEGKTLSRGKTVYSVNADPVVLLYGTMPLWRPLQPGSSGPDVKEVEKNLAALGYTGFTVDDDYTAATADAVRDWQDDLRRDGTGVVSPEDVVIAEGKVRIGTQKVQLGAAATGPILTCTGTARVVTVDLDVSDENLVKDGTTATVTLPDATTVKGSVSDIGTVASTRTSGSGVQAQTATTIPVTVTIRDQKALGSLDAAPVDVDLVSASAKNVLAVPVNALVALAEGGYGVQVLDGTTTRYLPVKTGLFSSSTVEISGAGLAEGLSVVIPRV